MKYLRAVLIAVWGVLCTCVTQADPAIWKVQGRHSTVYLLGTIHLLHKDQTLPANVQRTYAQAHELWLEVDLQSIDPIALQDTMQSKGTLSTDQTLMSKLDAATLTQLQATAARLNLPMEALSRLQPWLAAITLEMAQYATSGYVADSGVDVQLSKLASHDHKVTHGFETLSEQLDLFASLDQDAQVALLKQTLEELNEDNNEVASLEQAWLSGNQIELGRYLQEGVDDDPTLLNALTTRRNQRWFMAMKPMLDKQSSDVLVAVGALHLVGEQGLVALLQRAGYRVTRE
jgi:uncharacterized protein